MRRIVITFIAAILVGCQPGAPSKPSSPEGSATPSVGSAGPVDTGILQEARGAELKVGDIEQRVVISALLAADPPPENIKVEKMESRRYTLDLLRVNIAPPVPKTLPMLVTVAVKEMASHSPIVLRFKAFANNQVFTTKNIVIPAESSQAADSWSIDPFTAFPSLPESLLVRVEAEALLMPAGTLIKDVDPATATTTPDQMTVLSSNPVRITIDNGASTKSSGGA